MSAFPSLPPSVDWTMGVVGACLIAWLVARKTRWGGTVGWISLGAAGQACSLQLLEVGSHIRLQLFSEWKVVLGTYRLIFLLAVLIQAILVIAAVWRAWPAIGSHWKRLFSWPQVLVFLALQAFAAITIAPGVAQAFVHGGFADQAARHASKVALALLIEGTGALTFFLAALAFPADVWTRVVARWHATDRKRLPWLCAVWVIAVSSLLAWVVLQRMPHIPDEVAYIFQAKYVAAGHLYLPRPPDPEAFACPLSLVDGAKWYSAMLGGWSFVLALGYLVGLPWLVNPLLGGAAILLAHALVRRLYTREVADAVALLLAASPWLLFMSANFMPHAASLVFALLGLWGVERARHTGSLTWAAVSGLSFGALLHIRPLEAVGVALAPGVWWLSAGWKRVRLAALATAIAAGLVMTILFLTYNKTLTGSLWLAPVNKYFDLTVYPGANRLGFGRDIGNFGWTGLDALPGHGPVDVVMNSNQNLYLVNFETWGWACGSLLFVLLLFIWGPLRQDGLMWGLLFSLWATTNLYWFSGGPDFGARYWYPMILPMAVLTVRGAQKWAQRASSLIESPHSSERTWAFVALASLVGLVNVVTWRSLDKYPNYRDQRPDIRRLEKKYRFGRSLVFIRGKTWPDYSSALPFNPPVLDPDAPGTIYARDLGPESRERLRSYFADRASWIVAGFSETGGDFKVLEGPLPPQRSAKRAGPGKQPPP